MSFIKWIQWKLSELGRIGVGSDYAFRSACERSEYFKELLIIAVDPAKSLIEKVDTPWGRISGMGGDQNIPPKIIASYDDWSMPIFKTEDMEYCYNELNHTITDDLGLFVL